MRGQILAYVADKEMGLIATAEGQRLSFRTADWMEVIPPERGMAVECVALDAHRASQVQLALPEAVAVPPAPQPLAQRPKRKPVLTLLALFLGYYGAHRFYMGAWGLGLLQLLGLPVVVGILFALLPPLGVLLLLGAIVFTIVEYVRYIWMSDAEFDAKVQAYQATQPGPFSFFW
ncbi:TM2 domain-containing membrane protein YozV [Paenacidovorax caeni]|uniref:TM2 domain-containing membrane protein YozV n=1 Tax=Paenacidovorax caeni TaxID=343013 RepID=A0A1I7HK27_9BURK|nr:TM2 domain-containing protein [Paenacidovorax caeni]SFU60939.1 TM2 domain-containing membrane protein YozV [Paenacidovorax caeni]